MSYFAVEILVNSGRGGSASPVVVNCRFVANIAEDDGGDGWGNDPCMPSVDEGANDDYGNLRLLRDSACIDAGDNTAVPEDMTDLDGDGHTSEPTPFDLNSFSRFIDDICTTDTGNGTAPIVDMYNTPQKLGA